jgi:hypothetical protein
LKTIQILHLSCAVWSVIAQNAGQRIEQKTAPITRQAPMQQRRLFESVSDDVVAFASNTVPALLAQLSFRLHYPML